MIYIDTSVLLAALLAEDRTPPPGFWSSGLVSSRLAEYEVWVRLHARRAQASILNDARRLLSGLAYVEMTTAALTRALEPFPIAVRSLDAMHLASAHYLREQGHPVSLATYDRRMAAAARALRLPLAEL